MSVELQQIKSSNNLVAWAEMVRACKNSGMTVRAWCQENGINEKTYYHRQKRVCNALPESLCPPLQFAEVKRIEESRFPGAGIKIRIGMAEISVDGNTDLALLRDVLRVVTQTC